MELVAPAVLDVLAHAVPVVEPVVEHPVGIAAHQLVLGATVHATALALDVAAAVILVRQIVVHPAVIHAKMSASEQLQHQF